MALDQILSDPSKLGIGGLLTVAILALWREWVVPGTMYLRACAERDAQITKLTVERDEFKKMLMASIEIAERTQRVRGGGFVGKEPQP
jgi:hypothetical protein